MDRRPRRSLDVQCPVCMKSFSKTKIEEHAEKCCAKGIASLCHSVVVACHACKCAIVPPHSCVQCVFGTVEAAQKPKKRAKPTAKKQQRSPKSTKRARVKSASSGAKTSKASKAGTSTGKTSKTSKGQSQQRTNLELPFAVVQNQRIYYGATPSTADEDAVKVADKLASLCPLHLYTMTSDPAAGAAKGGATAKGRARSGAGGSKSSTGAGTLSSLHSPRAFESRPTKKLAPTSSTAPIISQAAVVEPVANFAVQRRPTRNVAKAFVRSFLEAFKDHPAIVDEFFQVLRQVRDCYVGSRFIFDDIF